MTAPQDPLLYRPEQVQQLDRAAIESGIDGFDLMRRAGRAAFRLLRRRWPQARHLLVFCGGGNNGGDGYVVAGMAQQQGLAVVCVSVSPPEKLKGEARQAWIWAREQGVSVTALDSDAVPGWLQQSDLVVDALLGTGLKGEVRSPYRELIGQINDSTTAVLAIDGPSGLCADTGQPLGMALVADQSIGFIGRKAGFYTGQARHYTGPVAFDDLNVPESVYEQAGPARARLLHWSNQSTQLPPLSPCAHKGHMGRVLVVGGDQGMGGAGLLAAEAALRCGSGLVYLATRSEHVGAALARRPEIQVRAVAHGNDLAPLLSLADVVVIGPGLGQGPWGQQMLQQVLNWQGPVVADADALNLLSDRNSPLAAAGLPGHWVATPHPGEAARLLGCTVPEIEQ
ncbi:MAG: NAD(P)H-hydrate epimerase, partial [Oleiphilaceae bacterium]|nr:NAD(P)H-hydrate epimerase [Oleiphilaceae bacterium]